jgi:hypothetical protein
MKLDKYISDWVALDCNPYILTRNRINICARAASIIDLILCPYIFEGYDKRYKVEIYSNLGINYEYFYFPTVDAAKQCADKIIERAGFKILPKKLELL